ncbi:MAG: hypothetical protein JWQ28_1032 [Pedobacter sp.]|jgi:hypothetical protein|nr:hypothetical protein [Pedobacter sp.]
MKKALYLFLFALLACNNPENRPPVNKPEYFGLRSYFQNEASRLQRLNPTVNKTVVANGKTETKDLKLRSWTKELSSFVDADINKRAWAGEFDKRLNDSTETYVSRDEKVPVKKVLIYRKNKEISGIVIIIKNHNYLYTSTDTLSYYPGKQYDVRKSQQIKLMSRKRYRITGIF